MQNAGPFTGAVGVGPFAEGLNVLTARNEAGKTTLLMAAARALFDRHTVTGDSIERLRPAGTSLAPDVTVVFATVEGRFRIHKRFLSSPTSELSEDRDGAWHPIADGDAADGKVLDLIGGVKSGRGVSKAEHWGLLRYLWARQGESADWPAWDDDTGARIRTGLAQVDIDPLVERLGSQFHHAQAEQYTATGRVARNGPLQLAQETGRQLESQLAEVRARMAQVEGQLQELQQLGEELTVREREKTGAAKQAAGLTETLREVELLQKDLSKFQSDFETAREQLNAIHKEKKTLQDAQAGLEKARDALTEREAEESRARKGEEEARRKLSALQAEAKTLQKSLDATRKRETRVREIQELRGSGDTLASLQKQLAAVQKQQHSLDQLRRKRAALPNVTKRQVTQLEELEQALRDLTIRAEAVGLRVAVTPRQKTTVTLDHDGAEESLDIGAGKTATVTAAHDLHLKLPEWGDVKISSGAQEATAIGQEIAGSQTALDQQLKKLGVPSIDRARATVEQSRDLDRDINSADARLAELLDEWDDRDSLAAETDRAAAAIAARREHLNVSKTEAALSLAELKAERATVHTALETDEATHSGLQETIETEQERIESCRATREEASKAVSDAKNRIASLSTQATTLAERYPDGIDQAEESAQTAFVEAKAQLAVARKKMPQDWEKLEARHERALKSAEQATKEYHDLRQRTQKLETLLEQAGSQGLYTRETQLEETLATARAEGQRLEDRALAARFLAGLIDYRKKAAVSTVLKPLEDQLSATFADITGAHNRRVFLDENLHVAGIGRKRDESYAFDQLSQGAREQLLLALRAAVALELARAGPQILILDDVLVNTDATRQENVLDFVGNIAQHVQVVVVTCHGDRYRGIGHNLTIQSDQLAEV